MKKYQSKILKSVNDKTIEIIVYIVVIIAFFGYFIFEYIFDMPIVSKWLKDIALTVVLLY